MSAEERVYPDQPWVVDWSKPWYHGSNKTFESLHTKSTITQCRIIAEAFSHQPKQLWITDEGEVGHDGIEYGYLYMIDEPITDDDLEPVSGSTMAPGLEWHTRRPIKVRKLADLPRE